jgi:DMSO/TMAO reductase YedYZ molybdopterin-dependent catalytic subunit
MSQIITRRALVGGLVVGGGALLSGCDRLSNNAGFVDGLKRAETLNLNFHRLLQPREGLAREFSPEDMSPIFRANGTRRPVGIAYEAHAASNFADWRLKVEGLVTKPLSLSLADIKTMPMRTQITRHDCVEGWSAIGKWHGVPLKLLLEAAGMRSSARYIVFHCADVYGSSGKLYYESIDLIDAFHPQTIVAWGMNNKLIPIGNGAPLRLRVERQLGYKHAKYIERIEAVSDLSGIYGGKGGFWEDYADYEWYGGI